MSRVVALKKDLVFVGGFAMFMHGLKKDYTDLDIVVTNLEGLGKVFSYTTNSAFSNTGKRAFIPGKIKVDIFIEHKLPEYTIIDGLKIQTIESMVNHYKNIKTDDNHWKAYILEKLKLLEI